MQINGYGRDIESNSKKQSKSEVDEKRIKACLNLLDQRVADDNNSKGKKSNRDQIEISMQSKFNMGTSSTLSVSELEKIANRKKIDFSGGAVSYTETNGEQYFTLPDGTNIPASQVSRKVDASEIRSMKVENNKLVLESGQYYSLTNERGEELLFRASSCLAINSFAGILTDEETKGMDTNNILTGLIECRSPWVLYDSYSRKQVSDLLTSMGFTPGKIELELGDTFKSTHFFTHSGELYGESEAENRIQATNMVNHFDYGVPAGSAYIVDGQRYEMDDNGYFHLPSGIMFCPGEVQLVDASGNPVTQRNPELVKEERQNKA